MSKAFAEANARKKKQQQQQSMTKEQRYEQTFVNAVNSRARERDNAVRSVQNLSQQIADNDRTGAYKGTLTDQHRRVNDLSSLRTQLQDLRRNFGLDIGDTSDIDNAIKQQTKFVNAFKNDGEYRTGYWFGEKYKGSNKQQVQSAISSLEKGNDAQKGEALWLKQNQYQYWNSADLQKQMEANLAEAKRLQSLVNEVHGNAKSNRMKQYGGKIDSLKAEANAIRRALEAKAKEKEIMKLAPSEREMLTKYGEAAAKEDAYMSVSSANPVSRLIANASLPKETKKVIEDTEKMLRKKGYTPEQIRTLRDYSVKDYNAKSVQAQAEAIQKFADKSGWAKVLASAGAIAADYVGGVQGVSDVIGQNLFGGKDAFTGNKRSVDYNSMFQQTGLAGEALKAGVTQDMGEFGKWAYGAGLSTIESLLGAYGMPGKTYELLMSGMAAQSAMQEMHRRGVDDGRVLGVGLAAGGLEALFEHASIENLRGIINAQKATGSGIKGAIERGLLQAGVEASEEGFTSLANTATELLALGDKSELKSNIKLYQQQGMSEEEATRKAGMEWLDSVLQDTAAGFASGGLATMPASIGFAVSDRYNGQKIQDTAGAVEGLLNTGLSMDESSPAYKVAKELSDEFVKGQKDKTDVKLSETKLGELYRKIDQQVKDDANSERAKIERQLPRTQEALVMDQDGNVTVGVKASRVAEALIASGESASVAVAKAPVIEKIVAGETVTDEELKKMGVFSAAVAKVVNTYTGSEIDPNNASESELIKAYHAAAAQQKTRIDETVKLGEDIKAARAELEAAQAEGEARLAEQEAALDEETQAAAAELEQSAPEQEQQSGSVIKVTNGDGTQVDMTLQDYIDSARQANPNDPRSDADLEEEFNTLLGHAAMNGGTVRAEDVPNIIRGAREASVAAEETSAEESTGGEETSAAEEEPAAEEGTGEEETKPKEEPAVEEPEAPVEDAPKEKRPLGEEIAKDIYFLAKEGNSVQELTDTQMRSLQIAMPVLRFAGITKIVVDEEATQGTNAFIDEDTGIVRINPSELKSSRMIFWALGHEVLHPATSDRGGTTNKMAEKVIEAFEAMYTQGVLTGDLRTMVGQYMDGKLLPKVKKQYSDFLGREVTGHYANQEIAGNMFGFIAESRPIMEKMAGYQPTFMTKVMRKLIAAREGITTNAVKDSDQRKATQQALDLLVSDINNALRQSKLAAFQPKTKAQERADQRAEKLAAKAQKQNAERVSRVKERARTADTGESVAESASPENKSVAKAMARLNKGANRTRTGRAALGLFPKDSNEHRAVEALGSGAEVITNGDDELVLAKSKDDHTVMYSLPTLFGTGAYYEAHPEAKSGIELLKQTLKANGHTDAEIAEVIKGIEASAKELTDLSERISQEYGWDEMKEHISMEIVTDLRDAQQVIYTLTPNGEYPVNLDLALVCKKRVAYTRVLAQLVRDGVLDEISFGSKAIARVNQILRDAGFETACLGCFVEARRTAIQKWAEDFIYEWNKVVSEHDPNAGYFNFTYTNNPETGERENEIPALSVKDVAALDRMYEFNLLNDQGNVSLSSSGPLDKVIELFNEKKETGALLLKLRPADLMTPEGITALKKTDKTLFNLAKARYGATQPKVLQEFHPYAGDMTNATFEEVAKKTGKSFSGTAKYREAAEGLLKRKRGESDEDYEIRMRELGVANLNGKEDKERRIDALAMRLYLYDIGGARIQSFSDFMIENTLDYLQIIADMSAARLPMHGYTKEIIAMKLFGMTGLKWNGSLIAHVDPAEDKNHAGLLPVSEASDGRGIVLTGPARVENGKIIGEKQWAICFDDYDRNVRTGKPAKDYLAAHGGVVKNLTEAQKREYDRLKQQESYIQSIGMKDIFALMMDPRYSKNIGNITIGVSDVQIIAMLRSDLFTMVIPYHKSGLPKIFAELMGIDNYNDYEDFQKTTVKQVYDENKKPISEFIRVGGKPVHANTEAFNFNEALQNRKGDARAAANDYIKWCAQMHKIVDSDGNTLGYETFNPKFSNSPNGYNFTKELNYYKLLEDFTALDPVTGEWTPQGPVQQYEMNEDATYDLSKPLLPSESNRLTDAQKEQYRERLRGIGIYTEAEIDKIIQKSDMTFGELVRVEAENRGRYHQTVDPKFDDTYEEILEALFDPELRSTRAERDAERQKGIEKKAADKAKKAEAKRAALDAEYFDAIDRGDTEEALRMLYSAAKKAGYKLEVYHGTNVEFTEFREYGGNEPGYHVGTRKAAEDRVQYELNPKVMKLYAKLGNKIDMPDVFGLWHGVYDYVQFAKGYDSDMVDRDLFLTKKKKANKTDQKNADLFAENEEYAAMKAAVEVAVNGGYKRSLIKRAVEAQRDYLISVGIDSVQYKNAYEGKGSKSYMLLHANQVKSADLITYDKDGNRIPLSQRFNSGTNDLRYSIAGENSILADTDELDVAKNMEAAGNNADQIRIVTGWYRGPDGKWRYEIDDSRMQFHEKGSAKIWNDYPDYKDFYELEQKVKRGDTLTAEEQAWFDKAKKKFEPLREKLNKEGRDHIRNGTATLDEVLVHPELFAAYPDLRKIKFRVTDMTGWSKKGILFGQYDFVNNLITLNKKAPWTTKAQAKERAAKKAAEREERQKLGLPIEPVSPFADPKVQTMRSTLLHEVQHAIQSIEGFARGTSPEYWEFYLGERDKMDKAYEKLLRNVSPYDVAPKLKAWRRAYYDANINEMAHIEDEVSDAADDPSNKKVTAEAKDYFFGAINAIKLNHDARSDFELYQDTVGEREARDVQQRINLTPAQRRRYHPDLGSRPVHAAAGWSGIYKPGPSNKTWNSPSGTKARYSLPSDVLEMDRQYMDAVESGDMEAAQAMVDEAARRAGYPVRAYHQTGADFTEFSTDHPVAGRNDSETPNGIFFKMNDHDIGLEGKKQMGVYLKTGRMLHFKNREQANTWYQKNIDGYRTLQNEMRAKLKPFDDELERIERLMFSEETDDDRYAELDAQWNDKLEEMRVVEDDYRRRLRELLNDYFLNHDSGYDSIKLDYDGHRYVDGKRENVETIILFDGHDVKSADPVTYDDGKVIPLSERFNPENEDIRFSLPSDPAEMDLQYMDAVESGDMETAQRMVDEAAARAGYTVRTYHGTPQEMLSAAKGRVSGDEYKALERDYADKLFPFVVFRNSPHHTGIYTATDRGVAEDFSFSFSKGGTVFDLYARAENPIVVDAGKNGWNNIPATEAERIGLTPEALQELREAHPKTRNKNNIFIDDLVEFAKARDYDSVIVENVRETGSGDEFSPLTTDVVVLDSSQLKSADPITYDDEGKVIPLSERFNPETDDIRYSLENNIFIQDGYDESTGEPVNFIDRILDGDKLYETRTHKALTRKGWVGIGKGGLVYGRVRLGDPIPLYKGTPEYEQSYIAGTNYDIKPGGKQKYAYPILEKQDFRDNPVPYQKGSPMYGRYDTDDIRFALNPDLFLTDDYKTYYQELFSDKGLSPEAVKKARANARDENISRIATTYKNFFDANERRRKGLRKGDLGYVPDTNAESMQRAQDRLDADFQGEYENLKKNGLNTDDDVDAAMGILNVLVTDARNTKDYKDVADWLQRIRANATRSGQIVQAFAKYAQTPEGILIEAEEILAQTDLSKADQGIILAQLAQFATTLNAIKKGEEGNRDDLIDLILDQAAIRNTKVSNQTLKDLYRQKIDFLYDAALNQMSQIAQDYLKPSLAKGAATYQTISHLFNARTAARNVVSNTVFSPVAAVANNLAVVPDIIISLFTKQKTVGFDRWWFSGKTWKGVEEGARRAHVEIALDIDPRPNSRDKYGTSRRTWKMTGNAASRVGSTIEKAMGFELNWTDEFHKGAVEAEILQSLQGLVDKGVIREEDAEEWARQEALYRSFQDDTFLSARLQDIKNLLNTVGFGHTGRYLGAKAQTPFNEIKEFGLGDLIQKYTQVPGALITRAIEFSPIGYVKMIANLAQMKNVNKALRTAEMRLQEAQDELDQEPDSSALINRVFQAQKSVDSARFKAQSKQRMAALAMGRATTGVGLIKAFAMLAASGLLHRPDDDDDPDATAMLQSMGVTGTQLNVSALARKLKGEDASWKKGDQLWAIDFLEPLNGLMTIGTKIIKEAKDDKTFKDKLDSAQRGTLDGLWNVIGEIPTMQSFSTIQQTLRYYDPEQWPNRATAVGIELARGSVTGFIPSLIRQTAQATDTVQRNTYTSKKPLEMTKDQIQNTLPYFRKKLPAKLDNYGQPRKQENPLLNALNAYVIPGSIRTYQASPEAKELASVSKKTGDVNIYPDRNPPSKITVSVDGEDYSYNLSAKQKQTYQATRGKYSYQFQHDMMSDPFYKSATAQEKNAMLTEAKQLADYMAKKEFLSKQKDAPDYTDSSHEKTLGALANGYTVASWVDVRTTTNKAKGVDADGDGKADSGTKKKEQLGIIQSYDLNDTQKTYWFRGSDYNGSDSGRDYIGEAIDQHITPTKYIDAALKLLDAHGTDNNNDGKTDSGSVLKSKAAIINSLALTAEQKKWLFLQGNSKSTKFANSYNWTDTSGN